MNNRFQTKSDLYVFFGYVALAMALAFNSLTLPLWQKAGLVPVVPAEFMHANDVLWALPVFVDALLFLFGGIMVWSPRHLGDYFNNRLWFNLLVFGLLFCIQLSTNPILPGSLVVLRILLMLVCLFFLTNSLYLAVVRDFERRRIQPFFRNLAVAVFGLFLVLALLEGVFMFVRTTHRFNGTLASRAWFMHNWELNADGYRDITHDKSQGEGKKKVMVLGDSFVAGHGIKDPKDRFSDRLAAQLGDKYEVYNLGVGGSDVRDAITRLREFPEKPDLLVYSYYPNDIEQDGERGGLRLQRAHSYDDVIAPIRYVVRRSYVLNYLYWRFPHPSELTDYKGYLKQCYGYVGVMMRHRQAIDELVGIADSLQIPTAWVVFPFIEDAQGSDFATTPILNHLHLRHVPSLDVRPWLIGKDPLAYMVNRNDPHPNETLHAMVADSLHALLVRNGMVE